MARNLKNIDLEFLDRLKKLSLKDNCNLYAQEEYDKLDKLPVLARPEGPRGHGTRGVPIELLVNWFSLNFANPENKCNFWLYEVTFTEIKRDAGRGRGRGRGRGGRGGAAAATGPQELTSRANKQIAIWRAVEILVQNGTIGCRDDVVFDEHVIYVPKDLGLEGNVTVDHPNENVNRRHQVRVSFRSRGVFPLDPNDPEQNIVDLSGRFIKALSTQRIRYLGGDQDEIKWHFQNGCMYQIPRGLVNPQEDLELKVLPGVSAWLGLYAALKTGETLDLFVNFGLINSLFYKMDMDLITFYMELCQDEGDDVNPATFTQKLERWTEYGMSERQRSEMEKMVKNLEVTSDHALMFEEVKRPRDASRDWMPPKPRPFLATRHFKVTKILAKCAYSYHDYEQGMTVKEMYERLGQPLRCPYLPIILVAQGGKEIYQPMEVLRIHDTPQRYTKILSETDTKKFLRKVSRSPDKYWSETNRILRELRLTDNVVPFFHQFQANLTLDWTKCEGRILPAPTIRELDGTEHKLQPDRSYQIKEDAESAGPIVIDVCTSIDPKTLEPILNKSDAGQFYHQFVKILGERKMEVYPREPNHILAQIVPDRISEFQPGEPLYIKGIDDDLDLPPEYKCVPGKPTFAAAASFCQRQFWQIKHYEKKRHIILIFTVKGNDFYKRVKRVCDIIGSVPTIVVDRRTVSDALSEASKNKHSIFYSLALKVNGRLGGMNTRIDGPSTLPPGDRDQIMYVGIDVTHPGEAPGKDYREANMNISLAAIVGSIDVGSARYRTYPLAQMTVRESVERFDYQFVELLDDFHRANGNYPKHVVIYRDGVSDSEMLKYACIELHWIQGSWSKILQKDGVDCPPPTFTYIVVQKRHHTRFIRPVERNGEATFRNPLSGTTVDRNVVGAAKFDFWMTGQQVSDKVTARPIHYTVVYDEWQRSADEIQEMTYRLCFLNARCRKPCSLPAPVHYAHLACNYYKEVYRDFIVQNPSEELSRERQIMIETSLNVKKTYPGMIFV